MLKEFKAFAIKGNVVDMAVGVVIGTAFGTIVSSLVGDVIMPPLGVLTGKVDFSNLFFPLDEKARAATTIENLKTTGGAAIRYGLFINSVINFLLIAFAVFLVIKLISRLHPPAPPPPAATKDCPQCAMPVPVKAVKCGHCLSALSE